MSEERTADAVPFAARHGLVRPLQGRYVAGACAALARATRTDPVLWRVTLAVLVCFAGVGALIYLLVWLVSPEEGDTASPVEGLLGRGQSSTSPVITVVLGLIAAGLLIFIMPRPLYVVLGGAVALALLLLVNKTRTDPAPGPMQQPPPVPPPPWPPAAAPVADTAPVADAVYPPAVGPTEPPPPSTGAPPTGALPQGTPPPIGPPPLGPPPAGYRPPFAPHGPFAGSPPPRPPAPPREHSALPALVFFSALIALGMLGMLDLAGALHIPASGYIAGGLAVVGAGLVVGAWVGRARPLIALGVVLTLALPAAHAAEVWDRPQYVADEFTWRPASVADLDDEYSLMFGAGELDLRQVDFSGRQVELTVAITFGEMRVFVPPDVAVEADLNTRFGSSTVLGNSSDGVTTDTVSDPGSGDPADGVLRLDLESRFGNLEVERRASR